MTRYPCPYDYPDNCNCNTCTGDRRGSHSRSSGRRRNRGRDIALQAGAAAISVGGYLADPGQQPNTGQLGDVHDSQMERHRNAIEDKSHEQGTETGQYY